ncbi:NAD-dependent epimerase/dehydratase family protein [Alicyclobacillus macrosporangiidus]|uniref:UDP-glucose 4-epimerase n=1 Tax=Alicyclobacillus macrosporangiidus TaxID=392015 RepID=A0A1I7K7F3_9BACL|nr:NAD-dependent epimerase/dehydratase family protein [Alicyclobacillus macrosporangiidus]SFU93302.1 UDP-glucose 4-epimerase [Alicyclobacillus macrosporangiidus]
MKLLVTGGAGFIGSHVAEHLLRSGHTVTVLDNLSTGSRRNVEDLQAYDRFSFVGGTVLDAKQVNSLVKEHDAVFHLAAVVGTKNCIENPIDLIHSNIMGTDHVVTACFEHGKKLVLASTSEVYGRSEQVPFREDSPRVFGPIHSDRWCYATTKTLDEYLSLAYAKRGLAVTILRYFNIYGPRANQSRYANVIPSFIRRALNHEPLPIHGTGEQTRSFTYVSDCVAATVAALAPSADGAVINVGAEEEISIKALARTIIRLSESQSTLVHVSYEHVFGRGHEDVSRRVPDASRARQLLHFNPTVTLEDGLRKTIEWYRTAEGYGHDID